MIRMRNDEVSVGLFIYLFIYLLFIYFIYFGGECYDQDEV